MSQIHKRPQPREEYLAEAPHGRHHPDIAHLPHYVPQKGPYNGEGSDWYVIAPLVNELGLHARPSALICKASGRFDCEVQVRKYGCKRDLVGSGSSIMSLIPLAAGKGDTLIIAAKNRYGIDDSRACVSHIGELIKQGFGDMQS